MVLNWFQTLMASIYATNPGGHQDNSLYNTVIQNRGTEPNQLSEITAELKIEASSKTPFFFFENITFKNQVQLLAPWQNSSFKEAFYQNLTNSGDWQCARSWVRRSAFFNWEEIKVRNGMRAKTWAVFKVTAPLTAWGFSLVFILRNISTVYGVCW